MTDRIVFNKIQEYLTKIDSNSDKKISAYELENAKNDSEIPSLWLNKLAQISNGEELTRDRAIMGLAIEHVEDQDSEHAKNQNSDKVYRFKNADYDLNYKNALDDVRFFIERNVEKWFSYDMNADGKASNIERHRFIRHNIEPGMNDGDLSETEYAKKYNLQKNKNIDSTYEEWINDWKEYVLYNAAYDYGVEITDEDIKSLDDYAKIQINKKLFKPGDTKDASLYNRVGEDAYTRLVTSEQTVSCCGGDITPPPMAENKNSCSFVFSEIESSDSKNSATQVKNRLSWAIFKTPPKEKLSSETNKNVWQNMTDIEYAQYHDEWVKISNMKAADYQDLLKPENKAQKEAFEANSNMSVKQIVDYINIVEEVTGQSFDNENWSIDAEQFREICRRVDGTYGDDTILNGKTKNDILPERQELYNYLKENNLLIEQLK